MYGMIEEDYDYDRIIDARREEFYDRCEECERCGEMYDPKYHKATRVDPAYVEVDECPRCGA